ncbi:MAG: WD40/YVTN/BNR-like repeat-containing protein [Oceanococcus sp.]
MSENENMDVDTVAHEAEGSWLDGWPAMLLSLIIISAAVYSFSPRPKPDHPMTKVHADDLLVTDITQVGQRLIAVGEQGEILFADAPQGPWQSATVNQQRRSNLTRVLSVSEEVALAVGHDGWILRSTDAGENWQEVLFDAEKAEPLLGISGPYDGRIFAYGAFGQIQISSDAGKTWQRHALVKEELEVEAQDDAAAGSSDPFSDNYDPFASFGSGGGGGFDDFSTRHINGITRASDGSFWLVGERGLIAQSTNNAETWTKFETGYSGSFYGVLQTKGGRIMAHGMRGNIYSSPDKGETWQKSDAGTAQSLFGGLVQENGDIYLAGGSNAILKSSNGGRSFSNISEKKAKALTDIVVLAEGKWLTAGEAGIRLQGPNVAAKGDK